MRGLMLWCVCLVLAISPVYAQEQAEQELLDRMVEVCAEPPSRPRREMWIFPLVKAGSPDDEVGWGRGVIAHQAMWKCSFGPERLLDTWFWVYDPPFVDQCMLGRGRRITQRKIDVLLAAFDIQNYTTGTLEVKEDQYAAELVFHGVHKTRTKRYSGFRDELHLLPCLIARDVLEYMELPLTEEQERYLMRPPLCSTDLLDEVAERFPAFYWNNWRSPYWEQLVRRCRTPWTEFHHLISDERKGFFSTIRRWGRFAPRTRSLGLDLAKAALWFDNTGFHSETREGCARLLLSLVERDPYNAYVVRKLARMAARMARPEVGEEVAERLFMLRGDSHLARMHHGKFLHRAAQDVRWSSDMQQASYEREQLLQYRADRAIRELEDAVMQEPCCWWAAAELIQAGAVAGLGLAYMEDRLEDVISVCPTDLSAYWNMAYYSRPHYKYDIGSVETSLKWARRAVETGLYQARLPYVLVGMQFRIWAMHLTLVHTICSMAPPWPITRRMRSNLTGGSPPRRPAAITFGRFVTRRGLCVRAVVEPKPGRWARAANGARVATTNCR